jgi:hypothetical protein
MSLVDDIKGDIEAARKIRAPWWGLLCVGISSLLLSWLLDRLGRFELVIPTLNSTLVLGFAVAVKRNLRRRPWFWGTMAIVAALHIPLILFFPWTTQWVPALAIVAIDSADLIVILTIISVVGKFVEGTASSAG